MGEPPSSLDAKLREDLRIELKRIQIDVGTTILYVTHDQIEAMTLADRIGVLAEGEVIQFGPPREVYETPINAYVARRLGSPQTNLLPPDALGVADGPRAAATIGIRPEDGVLGAGGVQAQGRTVERLGAETLALLEVADRELHALLGPRDRLAPGDETTVAARVGSLLYFDTAADRVEATFVPDRPAARESAYGT
jgi:multiple sugar transport system ATP-binding protein